MGLEFHPGGPEPQENPPPGAAAEPVVVFLRPDQALPVEQFAQGLSALMHRPVGPDAIVRMAIDAALGILGAASRERGTPLTAGEAAAMLEHCARNGVGIFVQEMNGDGAEP